VSDDQRNITSSGLNSGRVEVNLERCPLQTSGCARFRLNRAARVCNIPFNGIGSSLARAIMKRRPLNKMPHFCNHCEEVARNIPVALKLT